MENKLELLQKVNDILNISKSKLNKIIFVYSKPKVGSTSIITSLRMFASNKYIIIHIHDEEMLKVLINITDLTINDIILYNKYLGKEVYVIDIFRSPVEQKISAFFEKINKHFNANNEIINQYDMNRLFNRFNKIFTHIAVGDHFIDVYNIPLPERFDFDKKYLLINHLGINYLKLRLKDTSYWDDILTTVFDTPIKVIKDYETLNKPIKECYLLFKNNYKIPQNYLNELHDCKYLNYFYSLDDKMEYLNEWQNNITIDSIPFTKEEYKLYEYITKENNSINEIQNKHYLDQGCLCKACSIKRSHICMRLLNGENVHEQIIHEDAKNEFLANRIIKIKKSVHKFMPKLSIKHFTQLK